MGALDVCPFIPVRGVSVEECVGVAKVFGQRLAEEVGVPVFLYGAASTRDYRRTMPQIRAGEYEGLKEKVKEQILHIAVVVFLSSYVIKTSHKLCTCTYVLNLRQTIKGSAVAAQFPNTIPLLLLTNQQIPHFSKFYLIFQLTKEEWGPDYGTRDFVPSWGATVTGVRKFLIAYNVNMIATKEQAHR